MKKLNILIHFIGLSFVLTLALWTTFGFCVTFIFGGVTMYEPNLIIKSIELVTGILGVIYCIYLFKRFIYEIY